MDFNVRQEYLFQQQDFIGHSGKPLTWKIECDAIQDVEWANKKVKDNPFLIARLRANNEIARNKKGEA